MEVSRYLENIIAHAERSQLPQSFKGQVTGGLKYFLQQSLCDLDRRHSQSVIRQRWHEFETMILGTSLLDKFRANKDQWASLESFVGIASILPGGSHAKAQVRPKVSHLKDKDADMLMEYLARKCETKPVISESEMLIVRLGLYYLHLETRRGRGQRDKQRIKFTWKTIQPILRRIGLLEEFDREPEAIRKIKSFVSDRFL